MTVAAVERAAPPKDAGYRRAVAVTARCTGVLAAVAGLAVAAWFGATPLRVTVHDQVGVTRVTGDQATGRVVTDATQAETRKVMCVPVLQHDGSADQDPACHHAVRGRLGRAGVGVLVFVLGIGLWIASAGDRAIGLTRANPRS